MFGFRVHPTFASSPLSLHDALPICMYLDKPMRDHTLLQAIARVNRPHEKLEGERRIAKPCGVIVDFIGIFDKVDRKSTRLNSSHPSISYAVFCLKKKTTAQVSR